MWYKEGFFSSGRKRVFLSVVHGRVFSSGYKGFFRVGCRLLCFLLLLDDIFDVKSAQQECLADFRSSEKDVNALWVGRGRSYRPTPCRKCCKLSILCPHSLCTCATLLQLTKRLAKGTRILRHSKCHALTWSLVCHRSQHKTLAYSKSKATGLNHAIGLSLN